MSVHLSQPNVFPRLLKALNYTIQSAHVRIVGDQIIFDDDDGVRLATISENSSALASYLTHYPELEFSGYVQSQRCSFIHHIHFMLCISGIPEYYDGIGETLGEAGFYLQEPHPNWDEIEEYDNPHVLGRDGNRSARYKTAQPGQSAPQPVRLPKIVTEWNTVQNGHRYGCRGCENAEALVTWAPGSTLVD